MEKEKKDQITEEEVLTIQNQQVNLEQQEENPGIGYEIVVNPTER